MKPKKETIQIITANLRSRSTLPILTKVCIQDSKMHVTDLETRTIAPTGLPDGIYTMAAGKLFVDPSMEVEDFPALPDYIAEIREETERRGKEKDVEYHPMTQDCALNAQTLADALDASKAFHSKDVTRYILNGACLDFTKDGLTVVATDGSRLCQTKMSYEGDVLGRFVLSTSAIKSLCNAFRPGRVEVSFLMDKYAVFEFEEGVTVHCRLIEGTYPNYPQVIPEQMPTSIKLDCPVWIGILKEAEVMAKAMETEDIDLDVVQGSLTFKMRGLAAGLERWDRTIETEGETAEPVRIRFYLKFLRDGLNRLPDTLLLRDDLSPGRFDKGGEVDSVLMPVRRS
jgi:DNA polymerase III sliding clamp (beta) subunit (PCNA family)